MRGWTWVLLAALAGCTRLNGAFSDSQGAATAAGTTAGDRTSTSTGGPETMTSTSGATSVGSTPPPSLSSGLESSSASTTGETAGTSADSTAGRSATTDRGSSTAGEDTRVVFIYAAADWMIEGNLLPGTTPAQHCANEVDALCESDPVALLRQPDLTLAAVLGTLAGDWMTAAVFGIGSNGLNPLADSPAELLGPLKTSLQAGGVADPTGAGMFYSGGSGDAVETCSGWQDPTVAAIGSTGDFLATDEWFSFGSTSCNQGLPILCACLSVPDPFS